LNNSSLPLVLVAACVLIDADGPVTIVASTDRWAEGEL